MISIILVVASLSIVASLFLIRPDKELAERVREVVISPICRFLGELQHRRDADTAIDLSRLVTIGVVDPFKKAHIKDLFVGRYLG